MKNLFILKITHISQVAEARRLTSYVTAEMGFNEDELGKISIIVTELTNNLVKHTKSGGEFHLHRISNYEFDGIEMITIDKGPGMNNIVECMRDGYSTAGSPGTGLGSINRLSTFFDIYTQVDSGTVILSRMLTKKKKNNIQNRPFEVSAIIVPKLREEHCGDNWKDFQNESEIIILAADGLGHGPGAAAASDEALAGFEKEKNLPLDELMKTLHQRMVHTRGAAISLCKIDTVQCSLEYCGVGNIGAAIVRREEQKSLVSLNGTVGHEIRKIQTFSYPWANDSILIMHSDGLLSRWNFDKYPGLYFKSLTIICSILYRDYSRGNDDLLVLAARKRDAFSTTENCN